MTPEPRLQPTGSSRRACARSALSSGWPDPRVLRRPGGGPGRLAHALQPADQLHQRSRQHRLRNLASRQRQPGEPGIEGGIRVLAAALGDEHVPPCAAGVLDPAWPLPHPIAMAPPSPDRLGDHPFWLCAAWARSSSAWCPRTPWSFCTSSALSASPAPSSASCCSGWRPGTHAAAWPLPRWLWPRSDCWAR